MYATNEFGRRPWSLPESGPRRRETTDRGHASLSSLSSSELWSAEGSMLNFIEERLTTVKPPTHVCLKYTIWYWPRSLGSSEGPKLSTPDPSDGTAL